MSEEENKEEETVDAPEETPEAEVEAPAEEAPAEEAPAEAAPAAEEEPAEPDPLDELPWKERRRVLKSRESGEAGPQLTGEERDARRIEERKLKAKQRRKRRADTKADAPKGSGVGTPVPEKTRTGKPKERQGLVTSDKSDKTITVQIDSARRHPVYEKIVRQRHKIHVHDPQNEAQTGDLVRVIETRKLSKTKHWRLIEVIEKAR
ncbi:MAG: 30S ribosomal protein S17 [Solirubrobacterales bacterium]|nr:30S ribosomal protein S17 [Solirubrobacterales bacterium]